MWIKKLFRRNLNCQKCGILTGSNNLCEKCQRYFEIIEEKKQIEMKDVEENRKNNWIKKRDKFLEEYDG